MRSHSRLLAIFLSLAAISCSIKEDRTDCPCYLDISLLRQIGITAQEYKAWCSVWSEETLLYAGQMDWPYDSTCTLESRVRPKGMVRVVVSSHGSVTARVGEQMPELYASCTEVDCTSETASLILGGLDKRHCRLMLSLSEEAYRKRQGISVTVEAPYCGVLLPSLRPASGGFSFTATFDEMGKAEIVIPPQAGPGLRIKTLLDGKTSSTLDLYALMKENLYNWENLNLSDFSCELSLNSLTHAFEISDWNVIEIDEKTY